MRRRAYYFALILLAAYLLLFFSVRLTGLERDGTPLYRADLFRLLVLPEDFVPYWFAGSLPAALLERVFVLVAVGVLVLAAAAAGHLVLRAFSIGAGLGRLESFVFAVAVGLNVWSSYVLVVGLWGGLHCRALFLVPGVLVLAAAGCLRLARRRGDAPPALDHRPQSGLWDGWACTAVLFAGLILLGSMLPPTDFDVLEYHLQAPKEFYEQGRIGFLPHNVYANMPLGAEMWPLLAMTLTGEWWWGALIGKTLIGAVTLLAALGLACAARRFSATPCGSRAALIYLATPWIILVSINGLIDGVVGCYMFLAVYAMLLSREAEETRWKRWLLAGYMAGVAAGCKYPALLFVVVPVTCWATFGALGRPRSWKPLAALLLAVLVAGGPWYLKNALLTGNPVYPLWYSVFDGRTRTPEKDRQWCEVHRPKDFSAGTLGSDLARVALLSEWLMPLVMPLAAIGLLVPARRKTGPGGKQRGPLPTWTLGGYCLYVIAAWWLLTHRIDRFWIPLLPLVALLAAEGWLAYEQRAWRIGLGILQGMALVWCLLAAACGILGDDRYFASLAALRADTQRIDPWHHYFNQHVRQGKLLMVGDARPFDLEVPVLYNTCFDDCRWEQLAARRTLAQVQQALNGQDITYIFVHWGEIQRYRSRGNYGYSDFVQPEQFQRLVDGGVLQPLPVIPGHPGRGYKVIRPGKQSAT